MNGETILVFSASMRDASASLNTKLAGLVTNAATDRGAIVDLATMLDFDCPSYDGDAEVQDGIPAGARRLHDRMSASDAFVIVSPEYNASMPGLLKNAIDWTSRFRPQPLTRRTAC